MAFKKLAALEPLRLPIGDNVYEIAPVDADFGMFLTELSTVMSVAKASGDAETAQVPKEQAERLIRMSERVDMKNIDTLERMIGADILERLRADEVPWQTIQLVAATAMIWTVSGIEDAEKHWNAGGKAPKARTPQDRKPKKR